MVPWIIPRDRIRFVRRKDNVGDSPRCPVCGRYIDGLLWLPPYEVELELGGEYFTDICQGPIRDWLVSERFWELFCERKLMGLEFLGEVTISRVKQRPKSRPRARSPKYYAVRILRSRAALDDSASGTLRDGPVMCSECRGGGHVLHIDRIMLETGTHSGEDLFYARGFPGRRLASDRFHDFCLEQKVSGITFINGADYTEHDIMLAAGATKVWRPSV